MTQQHVFDKFLRADKLPHMWCPGCGNGIVINSLIRAVEKTGLDQNKIVVVAGIGCSSRANGYLDFCGLHTNHGRAIAYATGVKMHDPDLKIIVVTGDGDCTAIGGNHFIHACRRNIDITTVVFNNDNYGMTGGQYSPTTPTGAKTKTTVYGNIDDPFDICKLAEAAGASFVARSTVYHAPLLTNLIAQAIMHKGCAIVEAVATCPTLFGRLNKKGDAAEMLLNLQKDSVPLAQAAKMSPEELAGKLVIGKFVENKDREEYTERYRKLMLKAKGVN